MKILRMNDAQARVVEDILAGALEDIECEADESALGDEFAKACAHKAKLLRPVVNAFQSAFWALAEGQRTHLLDAITDEEQS